MTQYCNNKKCDKTHCARHRSRNVDFSQAEDKNTEGLFLCPAYYPVWKGKLKTKEKWQQI